MAGNRSGFSASTPSVQKFIRQTICIRSHLHRFPGMPYLLFSSERRSTTLVSLQDGWFCGRVLPLHPLMSSSLLQQLKQQTLPYHESLERQLPLLRSDLSLEKYRTLLEGFYGFYAPWEQLAAPVLQQVLPGFFDGRRKTPLLERDLQFLGSDPATLQTCSCLPSTDSLPALWGTLYVLEGATLGGQILTRHLTRQFPISPQAGCSFFASYGSAVGYRWRTFCDLLSSYSSPDDDPIIVGAAVQTFSSLETWLQREVLLPC